MAKSRDIRRKPPNRRNGRAIAILGGAALLLLGLAGAYRMMLGPAPLPVIGGPFALVDTSGRPRTEASFQGRYMLIFFGYTGCTDICPKTLTEMSEALDTVDPDAARIQPLFITVDPQHDTASRLRAYTAAFSSHMIGLTGTLAQLEAVERRYHVVVEPEIEDGHGDIDHSAVVYLVDPAGRFMAPIPADADRAAMRSTLRHYVALPDSKPG